MIYVCKLSARFSAALGARAVCHDPLRSTTCRQWAALGRSGFRAKRAAEGKAKPKMPKTAMLASLRCSRYPDRPIAAARASKAASVPSPAESCFGLTGQFRRRWALVENSILCNELPEQLFKTEQINLVITQQIYSRRYLMPYDASAHRQSGRKNPEFIANVSSRTVPDATGTVPPDWKTGRRWSIRRSASQLGRSRGNGAAARRAGVKHKHRLIRIASCSAGEKGRQIALD